MEKEGDPMNDVYGGQSDAVLNPHSSQSDEFEWRMYITKMNDANVKWNVTTTNRVSESKIKCLNSEYELF